MELITSQEFRLKCHRESPNDCTEYWEQTGKGDGQKEYAAEKRKWPDAEIAIFTREVVVTPWKASKPDEPCSGSGYSHGPHGKCSGYTTDRT